MGKIKINFVKFVIDNLQIIVGVGETTNSKNTFY